MCGILGAADFQNSLNEKLPLFHKGLEAIRHRGPDGQNEISFGNVYLGHNRLSIIDLSSKANQPMKSADADAYIIYNGEIYNYRELRSGLKCKNYFTSSDTETVLQGYLEQGSAFFEKLRGIFAFAIYDKSKSELVIARDTSGVKPLYVYSKGSFVIFGSEIKALLPAVRGSLSVNEDVLKCYLNLGYCPEPFTIYNEIRCVSPGTAEIFSPDGNRRVQFAGLDFESENGCSYDENKNSVREKFAVAVRRNLTADVEVAVALSGGIDSSLIYAFANRTDSAIKGLTVRFDDKEYSEDETAKLFAQTVKGVHQLVDVSSELNLETLNKILLGFDQPYADSSAVNVFYLTKATGKITKVLLGGDGGDELFNGYPSMTWLTKLEAIQKLPASGLGKAILSLVSGLPIRSKRRLVRRINDLMNDKPSELLYDWHSWFPRKTRFCGKSPFLFDTNSGLSLYNSIFSEQSPEKFSGQVVFDYFRKTMLSDYLRKTDIMSMMNSVEYRVPMLDEDLVGLALEIPFRQKSTLKKTKCILRDLHSEIYPPYTSKLSKKGFTIPLDESLTTDEFEEIRSELSSGKSIVSDYVSKEYVTFLFNALDDRHAFEEDISRAGIYQRILMLYSLSIWDRSR